MTETIALNDNLTQLRVGQKSWAERTIDERITIVQRWSQILEERKDELAQALHEDMGKPVEQAQGEIDGTRKRISFFVKESKQWLECKQINEVDDTKEILAFEPLGVIAHISAWNYPYLVAVNVIAPALIAGNAILYKPSEWASVTGQKIQETLIAAGVPENVFITACGDGSVGKMVCALDLDGYFFTGSVATGKAIMDAVADKLVPVQLELGGKDPAYVTDDVDIASAAEALADGAFYNSGQSCCSVERIYVHDAVYDRFIEAFTKAAGECKVSRLARPQHVEFLQGQVDDALGKGGKVLCGGKSFDGGYQATALIDIDHTMSIMRDESFGPLVGIQRVGSDEQALQLMDDTEYGLTAAVYCRDTERAQQLLRQLDVGTGFVNCCERLSPYLPWSGRRNSGVGQTLSFLGILAFVKPKAYHVR